jgi:hypothetical protein
VPRDSGHDGAAPRLRPDPPHRCGAPGPHYLPMPPRSTGLLIIAAGVALVVVGLLVATGALSWFGRLPGDIRIERPNVRVYVPITSMLIVTLVFGVVSWVLRRLF